MVNPEYQIFDDLYETKTILINKSRKKELIYLYIVKHRIFQIVKNIHN